LTVEPYELGNSQVRF